MYIVNNNYESSFHKKMYGDDNGDESNYVITTGISRMSGWKVVP